MTDTQLTPAELEAQLRAEFEQRDQRRLQLVSLIAHELAAPVTTAKGYLQLLDEGLAGAMPQQQRDIVRSSLGTIARMEQMVRDLSDFAKLEAGRLELLLSTFQVHTIVYEAINLLFDRIEAKGLDVEMAVSSDLPPVLADKMRVGQVMTNLMSNAVKYNREGGRIIVNAQRLDDFIEVSITDTGTGISEEEQARMFTPFFRSADGHVRAQPGTGLGLTIARQLVRLQKGDIRFTSQKDSGTTFYFTLPVAGGQAYVGGQPVPTP